MILKGTKEELFDKIYNEVYAQVDYNLYQLTGGTEVTMYQLKLAIADAIASGVQKGLYTLLENQYTDEDFEKDVTLK